MATKHTFHLNTDQVRAQMLALGRKARPAVARALNKSAGSGQTAINRLVASDLALPVGKIRPLISVSKAIPERLSVTFYASPARIPLIEFGAKGRYPSRGRGAGVTAKLPTGAGRYPHAFIAIMPSGHRGVFTRPGRLQHRLPIAELMGPSIAQSFTKNEDAAIERCYEQLEKNLPHELQFALSSV